MKRQLHCFASLLFLCTLFSFKGAAQSFSVKYDFSGVTTTSGTMDPTLVPTAPGVTFGSFSAVGALSANPNAGGRFSFTGWPIGATNGLNTFSGTPDLTKYYSVTISPQTNYRLTLTDIIFTLQRSGTGIRQYFVRSSADGYIANLAASINPVNGNLSVVPTNVFQVSDASSVAENGSTITLTGVTNISAPITFRFYGFNAEASGGTFSIDNVQFTGTATILAAAPNIIVSPAAIEFPSIAANTVSSPLSYTIQAANLTEAVVVSTAVPFTISETAGGTYSNTLNIPASDLASPKTIFVKFSPGSIGSFAGTITHSSAGAVQKTVTLSGQAVDPTNLSFNFNTCTNSGSAGSGFIAYSVNGPQTWTCTTFGRNSSNGVNMNGYSGGPVENEDWLISPSLNIASLNLPVLRYWSRGEFSGPPLKLLVSTNYAGSGDPNLAIWTDLNAYFPPTTNVWTLTDGIDLSAYKQASKLFIACQYISTIEDGAARWTVDDVDVTDRSTLLTVQPNAINFGEASSGSVSQGSRIRLKSIGFGSLTVTAPANFQVSTDSLGSYSSFVSIDAATAQNGTSVFGRFAPASRALTLQGQLKLTGTGLDSNVVSLSGTSFPKAETFDAGCYNLSFFGSNPTNNPTPEKIALQLTNIATVLKRLNLDVVGVEEVSNDVAFDSLVKRLPHHKGLLSSRWSYSFDPPDPNFPPQKTGFIYDSTVAQLVDVRDMFVRRYDSARTSNPEVLPNYPGGTPQSFWASGRLPVMATFNVTIDGVTKQIRVIDIHAKSSSDLASYNRRVYDVKVLKDSLDFYYPTDNIILVGDYNDRLFGTIYGGPGATSPYKPYVDDNTKYTPLTYSLDQAGRVSFIGGSGLIDHIITTNELNSFYINNSADIEDPRTYITNYNATTASDHLPVYARFQFGAASPLPVTLATFGASARNADVVVIWTTATELNNSHFEVERSANGIDFSSIATIAGNGNSTALLSYQFIDGKPLSGKSFYRLKRVDKDGKFTLSKVVTVNFDRLTNTFTIYPNPVKDRLQINSTVLTQSTYSAALLAMDGRILIQTQGSIATINQKINQQFGTLAKGMYLLRVGTDQEQYSQKFIKE